MPLPYPIAPSQTDAKSPIDQQLMDALRLNQEYLDTQIGGGGGAGLFTFRAAGLLINLAPQLVLGAGKKIDGALVIESTTLSRARLFLEKGGTGGALEVDVHRNVKLEHPIVEITAQYQQTTQNIGRVGSAINTQSIDLATPTISTQQITKPKAQNNIKSIINIGGNLWLYTFTGTTVKGNVVINLMITVK
jgi:hypothetical protein